MKRISLLLVALSLAIGSYYFLSPAAGCGYGIHVPDDPAAVQKMIATYRGAGPDGLKALLRFYDRSPDPKLIPIIDAVAGQRGAVTSRLFWIPTSRKPAPWRVRNTSRFSICDCSANLPTSTRALRRQIIAWLKQSPGMITVEDLNRRVYAELFLTPRTDPWLGLVPEATYSALCDDGCVARK